MEILLIVCIGGLIYYMCNGKTDEERRAAGSKLAEAISRLFFR